VVAWRSTPIAEMCTIRRTPPLAAATGQRAPFHMHARVESRGLVLQHAGAVDDAPDAGQVRNQSAALSPADVEAMHLVALESRLAEAALRTTATTSCPRCAARQSTAEPISRSPPSAARASGLRSPETSSEVSIPGLVPSIQLSEQGEVAGVDPGDPRNNPGTVPEKCEDGTEIFC